MTLKQIYVHETTKNVFNAIAKYLGKTQDELVREMLIDYVELNNIKECFYLISLLKDENNED